MAAFAWNGKGKGAPAFARPVAPRPQIRAPVVVPASARPHVGARPGLAQPAAGGAVNPPIRVSGCQNFTIANIIKGSYSASASNHGKPVYQKDGSSGNVTVLIYFWDERDGPKFNGWWFGPKVGGDQVWAYNGNKTSQLPPQTGWQVPWDSAVDPTVTLQHGVAPMAGSMAPAGGMAGAFGKGGRPVRPAGQSKQLEEMKKREEEQKKRQEEMKAKRQAEEAARKEQAAALAVRKAIQKVRTATPETYDELRAQLEETQAINLEAMGNQADKVSEEATKALEQAQKRIDEMHAKKIQEEQKKIEQERQRKEMEEKVVEFIKVSKEEGTATLAKVKEAEALVEKLQEATGSPEEIEAEAVAVEKSLSETREEAKQKRLEIMEKQKEVADAESFRKVKRDIMDLTTKLAAGFRVLDKAAFQVQQARQRAAQKANALRKLEARTKEFADFDKDKDGKLSAKEVKAYCKAKLSTELPQEILDKIIGGLEPITAAKFRPMHQKVFIAQWELVAQRKAQAEEEQRLALEERKQAFLSIMEESSQLLSVAEATATEAENKARPLIRDDSGKASEEIVTEATEAEQVVQQAEGESKKGLEKMQEAKEACEADESITLFGQTQLKKLEQRDVRLKGRLAKITAALKLAREKARRKAYAEFDQKRTECATAIRAKMNSEEKSVDQFFEELSGGEALSKEKFVGFLKGLALELFDGQAEDLFKNLAGEGELSKEGFRELVRVYYKCVKATVMSQEISIKSKTLRRLEVGEVLEALEGPCNEENTRVMRLRCQATQDELAGWVTISGNQGTTFLEPGGNFYTCVKETTLTDGADAEESQTIRRIAKGEVIEVLEFPKKGEAEVRVKAKAKLDGALGWISLSSSQGSFLEPC